MKSHDIDLMQHADGERSDVEVGDAASRGKVAAIGELGEMVRGHLELSADTVPAAKFDAMWNEIDKAIAPAPQPEPERVSIWGRVSRWFEQYRGHVITGMVSAGAVAALALVLRPAGSSSSSGSGHDAINVTPAAFRPTEIESLDTPGGTSSVFHMKDDEGGTTTVIWVTPQDTVEGI